MEKPDIDCTEIGYLLISELVCMPDRILAQKVELDIWANHFRPSRLKAYICALEDSEDESEFYADCEVLVGQSELIFHVSDDSHVSAQVPS